LDGYFLDANLLVLLVVGSENRDLIPKHRRLEHYSAEDFDILLELLENADRLYVTPNTLTETSNLLSQHGEPERTLLMRRLQYLIHDSNEIVVASIDASSNSRYQKLGLTDAALLELATTETPVLTVDLDLYLAAIESGEDRAINFTHYRNL
jgi:predicted nucleic acid-binding protein